MNDSYMSFHSNKYSKYDRYNLPKDGPPPNGLIQLSNLLVADWIGKTIFRPRNQEGKTPYWRELDLAREYPLLEPNDPGYEKFMKGSEKWIYDVGRIISYERDPDRNCDCPWIARYICASGLIFSHNAYWLWTLK